MPETKCSVVVDNDEKSEGKEETHLAANTKIFYAPSSNSLFH
jgi:hypothetical protein